MTNPPLSTRLLHVSVALALVCVAGWYSPFVTAGIWHVFHPGGWANYRGLRVRVPWPWTADTYATGEDPTLAPQGLTLKKTPFTVNKRSLSDSIFITVISQDPGVTVEQQTEAWMETFRMTHPAESFDSRTPKTIPANARCAVARGERSDVDVVWTCITVGGGWVANFEGSRADEPVFFDIVMHLKR
jgi:hypothetical protein